MKPTYANFEAKKAVFLEMPPVGAYIGEIKNVNLIDPTEKNPHSVLELFIDITEGEYSKRFIEIFDDQKKRFGDKTSYKGVYRLTVPNEEDHESDSWLDRNFANVIWTIEQNNPGFSWDWDEKKLKLKKIGFSLRNRLYNYGGKDRSTIEIGRFDLIQDIRDGKVKPMPDRDQRSKNASASDGYTQVDDADVPWG